MKKILELAIVLLTKLKALFSALPGVKVNVEVKLDDVKDDDKKPTA